MPELIVKLGDSIVQKNIFVKETIRIGRVPDNEIVIENLAVSRYHAVIEHVDGNYILSDLDSSNGVFVNGVRVRKTELQDRDVISVGKHKLYFYDARATAELKPRPPVYDAERTMLVDQPAQPVPPPQGALEIIKGRQKGARFTLAGNQTTLGSGSFNDIQLTDWFISKAHAVIERRASDFVIRDLGSWRHTYVNGVMTNEMPLSDGDVIQLGPSVQVAFSMARQDLPLTGPARIPVELEPAFANFPPDSGNGNGNGFHNDDEPVTHRGFKPVVRGWMESPASAASLESEPAGGSSDPLDILASPAPKPPAPFYDPYAPAEDAPEPAWRSAEAAYCAPAAPPEPEPAPAWESWEAPDADDFTAKPAPAKEAAAQAEAEPFAAAIEAPETDAPYEFAEASIEFETPEPSPFMCSPELREERPEPGETPAYDFSTPVEPACAPEEPPPAPVAEPAWGEPAQEEPPPAAAEAAPKAEPEQSPAMDSGELEQEILMWERALKNKNPIIRKQAARQLQKLTGKQYDYS